MGKPDVPHPPGLGFYEFSFFSAGEKFPTSLIFFFILFLFLIVFPRQFPICICDNFFSLCAVSLALLLFFYFLLHLILSQFSLFFGRFLFSPFSMSFCLTFRLALTCSSFLIFFLLLCRVFWKQKVKVSDAICFESFRHILLLFFFFFCPAEFELRLWLALKVLYELRISFNSLTGTSSSHEVVGCIISAFPLPIFHFHLAVSFL